MLVNPTSGKGRGAGAAMAALKRLRAGGCTVTVLVGADGEEARGLARKAVADGFEALVAVGGDGMVHLVLQAVAGTAIPLGIVPAGSGNDFARALGLGVHDPAAAADVIAAGVTRRVDAGRVTTSTRRVDAVRATASADSTPTWFAAVLSSGFDSLVNERGNRMKWPRGPRRYTIATLAELRTFQPLRFTVDVDGSSSSPLAMFVAVGNSPSYGGGMRICPDARLDDGLLTVTVVGAVGKARFLRLFPRVFKGTHVAEPEVSVQSGRVVTITAVGMTAYADGELVGPLPVTVECVPGALTVLVPPG